MGRARRDVHLNWDTDPERIRLIVQRHFVYEPLGVRFIGAVEVILLCASFTLFFLFVLPIPVLFFRVPPSPFSIPAPRCAAAQGISGLFLMCLNFL